MLRLLVITSAVLGCARDQPTEPAAAAEPTVAAEPADAAPKQPAAFMKAQLNDRMVVFNIAPPTENYIFGESFRLRAETADHEKIEIVGDNLLPADATFPLVLHPQSPSNLRLRYTSGGTMEWTDDQVTMRIESFTAGRLIGSLSSKHLRPNKPAVPIRISGAIFELNVSTRY